MRNFGVALLFALILVTNFAYAGIITSDRSIDHDLGNGKHQIQIFAAPQFRLDPDTNKWLPFTRSVSVFSNSSGLFINFSDQQRTRRLFNFARLPAACDDYTVQDDDGHYEFSATCNVPAGKGTFLKNFSGVIADRFVGGTAFEAKGIYIDFDNWNINTGAFNSSVEFINYSNGKLGVNLSWSSNQSQTIELDPLVSGGAADDVYIAALGGSEHPYIKFLTSVVPPNQTIADAELYLNLYADGNFDPGATRIFMRNGTTDWKTADTAATIYGKLYTNDTNTNWTLIPTGILGWHGWNVTNSFSWAYSIGANASFTFNYTKPLSAPSAKIDTTFLLTGNNGACGGSGCQMNFNSSTSVGGFFPQLNITYYVPPVPSMLTCNDGSYIVNQSGQVYFYANQTGISCQIRVLNENLTQIVGYSTMTESGAAPQWFNYSVNFSRTGKYWASFNCSNGYSASNDLAAVASCSQAMPAINSLQVFKNSENVSNSMLGFVLTFAVATLFFLLFYWWLTQEEQRIKEHNESIKQLIQSGQALGDMTKVISYASKFNRYMAFALAVASLSFMFYFSWVSLPLSSTNTITYNYTNYSLSFGGSSGSVPIVSGTDISNTQALPASANSLALGAFTLYTWIGVMFVLIFTLTRVLKWIADRGDAYARKQRGDYGDV